MAPGHREHLSRGVGESKSFRLEPAWREEPGGCAKLRGERMDRRLGRLQIERDHAGDRAGRELMALQGRAHEVEKFFRRDAPLAPHAEREDLGVNHQAGRRAGIGAIGDAHVEFAMADKRRAAGRQPCGLPGLDRQSDIAALEQGADDCLGRLRVVDAPARWRIVEGELKAGVACGRDRGRTTERGGDAPRHPVGAVMPTQERHGDTAVLGDRDHGRLASLVHEQRRQDPDHDRARAQRHDRPPAGKQIAQRQGEIPVEEQAGFRRHSYRRSMQLCVRDRRHNALCDFQAARAEQDDRCARRPSFTAPAAAAARRSTALHR